MHIGRYVKLLYVKLFHGNYIKVYLAGADLDRLRGFQNPVSIFKLIRVQGFRPKKRHFLGLEPCQLFKIKLTGFQNESDTSLSLILI